jgi:Leucine-rich repeat (LRR) protein
MKLSLTFVLLIAILGCSANKMNNVNYSEFKIYTKIKKAKNNNEDVRVLFLVDEDLEEFPPEILTFHNLKVLNLTDNKIKQVPNNIDQLLGLEQLILMKNNIKQLPVELTKLKNLKLLNLAYNGLSDEDIKFLRNALPNCEIIIYFEH